MKLENVLLDSDGHAVLADFGLAKELDEHQRAKTICGTPGYLAPECVLGETYTKAIDYWSLGVMCYELLTSATPFPGRTQREIFDMILNSAIPYEKWNFSSSTLGVLKAVFFLPCGGLSRTCWLFSFLFFLPTSFRQGLLLSFMVAVCRLVVLACLLAF